MSFIDDPRQMIRDVQSLIQALEALQSAKTPEEEAAAKLEIEVECALQWEVSREQNRRRLLRSLRSDWGLSGPDPDRA